MEYKQEQGRIAVYENGAEVGKITWTGAGDDSIIIDHTYVDDGQRGKGIAGELLRRAVDMAKAEGKTIIPLCPYAKREFDKNPDYQAIQAGKL